MEEEKGEKSVFPPSPPCAAGGRVFCAACCAGLALVLAVALALARVEAEVFEAGAVAA